MARLIRFRIDSSPRVQTAVEPAHSGIGLRLANDTSSVSRIDMSTIK
jgi:hypothetical protein